MNKTDKQLKEKKVAKVNPPKAVEKVDKKVLPFDDGAKKAKKIKKQ